MKFKMNLTEVVHCKECSYFREIAETDGVKIGRCGKELLSSDGIYVRTFHPIVSEDHYCSYGFKEGSTFLFGGGKHE